MPSMSHLFRSFVFLFCLLTAGWAQSGPWSLALHGGAGADPKLMTADEIRATEQALAAAVKVGAAVLEEGGTALDCVETVVRYLEDSPEFNAGKGAVFNAEGRHELDASIMDGQSLSCGAVASLKTVKNPVSLARRVMTETRHVFLAGDGAEQFATEQKVERVENSYFSTPARRADWEKTHVKGTVGCVALDTHGNLAAATSTGGLTNKKWGRIGDSPVIGAGTYADNRTCAVSCTGTGEEYIRRSIAHDISARMLYADSTAAQASKAALDSLPDDTGGMIVVGHDGTIVLLFNTAGMARGAADSQGLRRIGIGETERNVEEL